MKKDYVQPEVETMVMPMRSVMGDEIALASSSTMGEAGYAPARYAGFGHYAVGKLYY